MKHTPGPWIVDPHGRSDDDDGTPTIVIFGPEGAGFGRVGVAYAEIGLEARDE